jgi:hypothetical protein
MHEDRSWIPGLLNPEPNFCKDRVRQSWIMPKALQSNALLS